MVRNTKFCSGPTVNVQDTIFHLFVKPPFQGCPGQGRGIFDGHLWRVDPTHQWWEDLSSPFSFFIIQMKKWKWSNHSSWTLTSTMSSSYLRGILEGQPWGATLRGIFEGHLWGASLRGILEGHPWGATLRGIFEGHLWRVDPTHQWWEDLSSPFSFFIIQMKNESDPTTQAGHWLLRCRRRRRSRGRPGESGLLGVPISKLGGPY